MATDLRAGMLVRAARRRLGLRQSDLAVRASVSQQSVSLVESGQLGGLAVHTVRAVAEAVGVDLPFAPRFRGADGDRLLDARHAALVEAVVARLGASGWRVEVEHSFSQYGDRGSVDVLGWREDRRALVIVEVKSELVDVQDLLRSLDVKRRVVPPDLARQRGWRAQIVAVILVLPDERGRRASVARHRAIFAAALPARTIAVWRWLRDPAGNLRAIAFLQPTSGAGAMRGLGGPRRVRRPSPTSAAPPHARGESPSRRPTQPTT